MSRAGITYEEVVAVAQSMEAEGLYPSLMIVHERLGGGPIFATYKHLKKWRESRPAPVPAPIKIPQELIKAFNDEINKAASKAASSARAESKKELAEAKALVRILLEKSESNEQLATKYRISMEQEQKNAELARSEVSQLKDTIATLKEQLQAAQTELEAVKAESAPNPT